MQSHGLAHLIVTSLTLGVIILATVVGNIFVIAAIGLERNLHHIGNYLIASLAVADLMVATLVMPLAAVNEVTTHWSLGPIVCDMWISFDVLCCTSSILHLVAISLDRYWAVNRADYIHNRSARRICGLIALSWGLSAIISFPPLFERGARRGVNETEGGEECLISQNWGYTVFSTVGAFYIPLIFMLIIYLSVFRTARARIRKRQFAKGRTGPAAISTVATTVVDAEGDEAIERTGGEPGRPVHLDLQRSAFNGCDSSAPEMRYLQKINDVPVHKNLSRAREGDIEVTAGNRPTTLSAQPWSNDTLAGLRERSELAFTPLGSRSAESTLCGGDSSLLATPNSLRSSSWLDLSKLHWDQKSAVSGKSAELKAKEKRERKRERKAARTLAIITGSFITCWLPFFILALVRPFCGGRCHYPPWLTSVIGWLGYFNCLLNPIIYTVFNPDFRRAFRKILFGKYRMRKQQRLQ